MRIFNCDKLKWETKFIITSVVVIILAIISGIVLFKLSNFNDYAYDFADIYIFYIFNFKNGSLFLAHFLSELFYFYVIFLLCYFTKIKALGYVIAFIKTAFAIFYCAVLFAFFGSEGAMIAIIVFIPSFIVSLALLLVILEQCKYLCCPLAYFIPAICALITSIIFLLLINVIFRVIVVIV